ncbi:OmpA family protein [Allochromatium warmingii]|uniref:OmpA family protein n=1 Tax=Allochromatium warmingii TaxID=61595 RepID=A0A1H3E6E9_ALLWA|nr:OmpA family protein [Allochromatium warmingii]SDX73514.1 OmpA family protein [Allochromatium warmingii]
MSEPSPSASSSQSFWKLIALALLLALIGVYILYNWYDGRLKTQLTEKDGLIVQLSDRIKETEARRLAAEEGWNASRAELVALTEQFAAEKQGLNDQIRMLEEVKLGLGQDMEGVKAAHAAMLADERRKTAEVVAEKEQLVEARNAVQAQLDAERATVEALKADLGRVNQAIAAAATRHQQRIADLERQLNERVALARTTPEDAELVRTVQELGLLGTPTGRTAEAQTLADELTALKNQFAALQTEHDATRARLSEAQTEQQRLKLELEWQQRELTQAQAGRDAVNRVAELEADLSAERAAYSILQNQHESETAAHATALAEREQQIADLQTALDAARTEAQAAAQFAEQLTTAQARIQELEASLERLSVETEAVHATLNADLEQAQTRVQELEQAATAAQTERQALADAQARIATLEAELAQVQMQAAALTDAQARIIALEAELQTAQQAANAPDPAQEAALVEAQARITALETELQTAQQAANTSDPAQETALADAQARITALEAELATTRQRAEQAEQAHAAASAAEAAPSEAASELARLQALQTSFAQLHGEFTDRGMLLSLAESELRFAPGQAVLPEGELPSLERLAELLNAHPQLTARIEGHTDSIGGIALNQTLSLKRAEAVRQALIARGVAAERLTAEGLGPARPIATNATPDGRGQNRRVEVYLLGLD